MTGLHRRFHNLKSLFFKLRIIGKCLTEITGTYDDHIVCAIQTQDFRNFRMEIFYIISVSLLSKSTKIVQILRI